MQCEAEGESLANGDVDLVEGIETEIIRSVACTKVKGVSNSKTNQVSCPPGNLHAVSEQVEGTSFSRLNEEQAERMVEDRDEMFSMTLMAGELRWIMSKDMAEQKRILALERELEDRYYALQEQTKTKELERLRKGVEEDRTCSGNRRVWTRLCWTSCCSMR